jgi:anaerobic magnesium-protoporphyrin IX monomethyl ester cyclase
MFKKDEGGAVKVVISYPPLNTGKGCPTLGQNRQFQYFKEPTFIYPVVPAQAATLLKQAGHEVIWNDCLAQGWSYQQFLDFIKAEKPDLVAMETKTPVVKQHWRIINDLKKLAAGKWQLTIVLFGDHTTALPEESLQNSPVDFVLTGGDYDFLLLNLCNNLRPAPFGLSIDKLEPGIYYRLDGEIKNSGGFKLDHDLNTLPFIDRDLTRWKLYAFKNGNYKRTPGTYIMAGRDCWWGRCTFCSWPTLYPNFRSRKVENVLDEIGLLIDKYRVKEIMDDTGTFPAGEWLRRFCTGMIERGYNRQVSIDCNMRFGALAPEEYHLMKKAGFRLLLSGLESANQETLDRIDKHLNVSQIIDSCRAARQAGLFPHITIMFGYPWEDFAQAKKTLELGRWLLKKGFAYTVQATVVIPYPGSLLFKECSQQGQLNTLDWSRYDMKEPIMKINLPAADLMALVRGIYATAFSPEFVFRKLLSIHDWDDLKYFLRSGSRVLGHLFDFKLKETINPN